MADRVRYISHDKDTTRELLRPETFARILNTPQDKNSEKKRRHSRSSIYAFIAAFLGIVFILTGVCSYFLIKSFVEDKILENYSIVEGTPYYKKWKDPPILPTVSVRFFNITNLDAFLSGKDRKPILEEKGPYIYRQKFIKDGVEFPTEDSVQFTEKRLHFFARDLTPPELFETDTLVVPNIPLFGAINKVSINGDVAKSIFQNLINSYDVGVDRNPFLRISVKEYLWGYSSLLLTMDRVQKCDSKNEWSMQEENPDCDIGDESSLEKFGLFRYRNNTSLYPREINSGSLNIYKKGIMISWKGESKLNFWASDECNKVKGFDPASLPLNIKPSDTLEVFIGQLCRTVSFQFLKQIVYNGMTTLRFVVSPNTFDSPDKSPRNQCYCLTTPCLPSGLLDISGCQKGSPVYLSWPHFLHGSKDLLNGVEGLEPNEDKHTFYMDIEPKYGIQLSALGRMQMNIIVKKDRRFTWFKDIIPDQTVLPILWIEEGIRDPTEDILGPISSLLTLPNDVKYGMSVACFLLGIIFLIPQFVLFIKYFISI